MRYDQNRKQKAKAELSSKYTHSLVFLLSPDKHGKVERGVFRKIFKEKQDETQ